MHRYHILGIIATIAEDITMEEGNESSRSELARVVLADSLLATNWPGSEKAMIRKNFSLYLLRYKMVKWDIKP